MKRDKTMDNSSAAPVEPGEAAPPQAELRISDLETLRVIADPIRLRLLELLVLEPQPVKRLAATLGLPQTKLYYHINLLEERGLIRVTGTRVISGIIEKQYGAMARAYRIDDALLALSASNRDDTFEMMLGTLLDGVRNDMRQAFATNTLELSDDTPVERKVTIGRMPLRLTAERAAELHQRLGALIEEFCADGATLGASIPDSRLYHLFIAYFPTYVAREEDKEPGEG